MEYALQFAYLIGTVLTFLGLKNPPVGGALCVRTAGTARCTAGSTGLFP